MPIHHMLPCTVKASLCHSFQCVCNVRDTCQRNPEKGEFSPAVCCSSWTKRRKCPSLSFSRNMGGNTYFWTCVTLAALGISVTVLPAAQAQPGPGPADNVGSTSPRSTTPRGTRISRDDHLPNAGPLPPRHNQASSSAGGSLPAGQHSQDRGRLGGGGGSIGHPPLPQAGATSSTGQQAGPIQLRLTTQFSARS